MGGSTVPAQETTRKPSAILELEEEFNRSIANFRGNKNISVPKDQLYLGKGNKANRLMTGMIDQAIIHKRRHNASTLVAQPRADFGLTVEGDVDSTEHISGAKWNHGRPTTTIVADAACIFSPLGHQSITPAVRTKLRTRQNDKKNLSTNFASIQTKSNMSNRGIRLVHKKGDSSMPSSRIASKARQGTPAPLLPPLESD